MQHNHHYSTLPGCTRILSTILHNLSLNHSTAKSHAQYYDCQLRNITFVGYYYPLLYSPFQPLCGWFAGSLRALLHGPNCDRLTDCALTAELTIMPKSDDFVRPHVKPLDTHKRIATAFTLADRGLRNFQILTHNLIM